jgi:hypothetical protein
MWPLAFGVFFFDYDLDGYLDLFAGLERPTAEAGASSMNKRLPSLW